MNNHPAYMGIEVNDEFYAQYTRPNGDLAFDTIEFDGVRQHFVDMLKQEWERKLL